MKKWEADKTLRGQLIFFLLHALADALFKGVIADHNDLPIVESCPLVIGRPTAPNDGAGDMKPVDVVTLPIRAGVLLSLWAIAYSCGYGIPKEEWKKESPETGLVVRYSRNNRPWRTFNDRDRNGKWDRWIDERAGHPFIVSIDDDGDGKPDREEDELGRRLSASYLSALRAHKTLVEFLHNRRQLVYSGLVVLFYGFLELAVRVVARR